MVFFSSSKHKCRGGLSKEQGTDRNVSNVLKGVWPKLFCYSHITECQAFFILHNHTSQGKMCESFTGVKDSLVLATSVKKSHEFFTGVTYIFKFFTVVTGSYDFHIGTNLSHVWRIRTYLSYMWTIRIFHRCDKYVRILHTCEKFERILHRCDKYVRILHTSKIRHLWKTRTY